MLIGYARVSTEEQNLDAQIAQLRAAGCERVVDEKESGADVAGRDGLRSILRLIGPGDVLVVCKLDRLARRTLDMLQLVEEITKRGAGVRSLAESWADTTSPAGTLMLTVMAGIAQFERERMLERQRDGIDRAKAAGKYMGRKREIDPGDVARLRAEGLGASLIARTLRCSRQSVYRLLREAA